MSPAATTPVTPAAARHPRAEKRRARLEAGRRTLARIPLTCVACAAIAFVNGALWAIIHRPFRPPTRRRTRATSSTWASGGTLPGDRQRRPDILSQEMAEAGSSLPFTVEGRPTWFKRNVRGLRATLAHADRRPGSALAQSYNNPPLYYVLDAVPYRVARSAYFFDRLFVMRLFSACWQPSRSPSRSCSCARSCQASPGRRA